MSTENYDDEGLESTKVISTFSEEDTDSNNNKKEASQEEKKANYLAEATEIFSFPFLPSEKSSFYMINGEVRTICATCLSINTITSNLVRT